MLSKRVERRSYYRIDDTIGLRYSILDNSETAPGEDLGQLGMPLTNLFAEIDREFNLVTNTLWRENPSMAQALGLLNRKISLIAAHSLRNADQPVESYEELMVSISGSGLAFSGTENLPVGSQLHLSVLLKPSDIQLNFVGEVVACEQLGTDLNHPYWIRVNIAENDHSTQEQLIQHVVQKQCIPRTD